MTNGKSGSGGKFLAVLLVLALGALVIVLAVQSRSNGRTVADLRARIDDQAKATKELRTETERLSIEKYEKELDVRSRDSWLADLRARVEKLDAKVAELTTSLDAARKERDEHLAARVDLARRLESMESAFAKSNQRNGLEVKDLEAAVATLQDRLRGLQERQDGLQLEKRNIETQIVDLRTRLRSRDQAVDRLRAELEAALGKAVDLKREVAEATAAKEEMSRRLLEVLAQLKGQEVPESSGADR